MSAPRFPERRGQGIGGMSMSKSMRVPRVPPPAPNWDNQQPGCASPPSFAKIKDQSEVTLVTCPESPSSTGHGFEEGEFPLTMLGLEPTADPAPSRAPRGQPAQAQAQGPPPSRAYHTRSQSRSGMSMNASNHTGISNDSMPDLSDAASLALSMSQSMHSVVSRDQALKLPKRNVGSPIPSEADDDDDDEDGDDECRSYSSGYPRSLHVSQTLSLHASQNRVRSDCSVVSASENRFRSDCSVVSASENRFRSDGSVVSMARSVVSRDQALKLPQRNQGLPSPAQSDDDDDDDRRSYQRGHHSGSRHHPSRHGYEHDRRHYQRGPPTLLGVPEECERPRPGYDHHHRQHHHHHQGSASVQGGYDRGHSGYDRRQRVPTVVEGERLQHGDPRDYQPRYPAEDGEWGYYNEDPRRMDDRRHNEYPRMDDRRHAPREYQRSYHPEEAPPRRYYEDDDPRRRHHDGGYYPEQGPAPPRDYDDDYSYYQGSVRSARSPRGEEPRHERYEPYSRHQEEDFRHEPQRSRPSPRNRYDPQERHGGRFDHGGDYEENPGITRHPMYDDQRYQQRRQHENDDVRSCYGDDHHSQCSTRTHGRPSSNDYKDPLSKHSGHVSLPAYPERKSNLKDDKGYGHEYKRHPGAFQVHPHASKGQYKEDYKYQKETGDVGPEGDPNSIDMEVFPGVFEKLRGTKEIMKAVAKNFYTPTTCVACSTDIFCISDAKFVICPKCRCVSLLEADYAKSSSPRNERMYRHGVGIGFDFDTLVGLQSSPTSAVLIDRQNPMPSSHAGERSSYHLHY